MDIAEIIIKKLNDQLSDSEYHLFKEWLEFSDENKAIFMRLERSKTNTGNVPNIDHIDPVAVFNKLKIKTKRNLVFSIMRYASISIIFIVGGYSIWHYAIPKGRSEIIDPYAVILEMGDGQTITLSAEKQQNIVNESGNFVGKSVKNEIDYTNTTAAADLEYNYLKVPNGKTFNVRLSDGTLVHLNAGSSLKYPAKFSAQSLRKVTLFGEAFFEVTKDKKHPFVVNVNSLDITVLGTKFNVSSYPEDVSIKTVLIEGSVKLSEKGNEAQFLKPGHEADWDRDSKKMKFSEVDTSIATRWMEKELVIDQLSFDKMKSKLERYYGVTIENKNKSIQNQIYTAEFSNETIKEVLDIFQVDTEFKYKIKDKHIIIY